MITKYENVRYLAGLIAIMDSMAMAGRPPSTTITDEYTRAYEELKGILTKEKEDEARNRNQHQQRAEAGADLSHSQPGRGEPDRQPRR